MKTSRTLLAATGVILLILLIVIYRSPIFWLIPFLTATASIIVARGACAIAAGAGLVINDQSANILPVLLFGASTDYALLIVARYRDALRGLTDRRSPMRCFIRARPWSSRHARHRDRAWRSCSGRGGARA